jgi:polyferredoxin
MTDDEMKEVEAVVSKEVMNQLANQRKSANDQEVSRQDSRVSFQETCNAARHYSALRFATFTVFTTILAALVGLDLRPYVSPAPAVAPPHSLVQSFRVAALALALLFGLLQWRVTDLIVFYQEKANNLAEQRSGLQLPVPPGHKIWKYVVRVTMIAPFVLAFVFWAWRLRQ